MFKRPAGSNKPAAPDAGNLAELFAQTVAVQQQAAARMTRGPFYLQEQMDLNPVSLWYKPTWAQETGGFFLPGDATKREITDLDPNDCVRRDMLVLLLRSINERKVPGDLAELGVYRGLTARLLHRYMPDRLLHLFDTFEGFASQDMMAEQQRAGFTSLTGGSWKTAAEEEAVLNRMFRDTGVEQVLSFIQPVNKNVRIYKGHFPGAVPPELDRAAFAFVHLDADIYEPTLAGLQFFYPRVSPGGFIVVHDYNTWPGARKAVNGFFRDKPELPVPMPDKSGSVLVIRH